jgi:hypothetical protein
MRNRCFLEFSVFFFGYFWSAGFKKHEDISKEVNSDVVSG